MTVIEFTAILLCEYNYDRYVCQNTRSCMASWDVDADKDITLRVFTNSSNNYILWVAEGICMLL